MEADVTEFVSSCLHCIIGKTGNRIPRPVYVALHGTKPNQVVHIAFIFMGIGVDGLKYSLIIRGDLSFYLWICSSMATDAETASIELSRRIQVFTAIKYWVSDQVSHFKNQVMETLVKIHKVEHRFTVAYSPWVNATIEVRIRHFKVSCTALLSQLKLGPQDWPLVTDTAMTALNEAPRSRLGKLSDGTYRTPLEIMTGILPNHLNFLVRYQEEIQVVSISQVRTHQRINVNKLHDVSKDMHRDMAKKVSNNRKKQIAYHNQKTNLVTPSFTVGDFALVRRSQNKGHKMMFRWVGPRRISRAVPTAVGDIVYEESGFRDKKTEIVRAARLLLCKASSDGARVSKKLMQQAEHIESRFEIPRNCSCCQIPLLPMRCLFHQ